MMPKQLIKDYRKAHIYETVMYCSRFAYQYCPSYRTILKIWSIEVTTLRPPHLNSGLGDPIDSTLISNHWFQYIESLVSIIPFLLVYLF